MRLGNLARYPYMETRELLGVAVEVALAEEMEEFIRREDHSVGCW